MSAQLYLHTYLQCTWCHLLALYFVFAAHHIRILPALLLEGKNSVLSLLELVSLSNNDLIWEELIVLLSKYVSLEILVKQQMLEAITWSLLVGVGV